MKISGSFLTMLIVWALGFTHFLGGPFLFFKFVFWIMLLPFFISIFAFIFMIFKARQLLKKTRNDIKNNNSQETIHVEATIKE